MDGQRGQKTGGHRIDQAQPTLMAGRGGGRMGICCKILSTLVYLRFFITKWEGGQTGCILPSQAGGWRRRQGQDLERNLRWV